MYNNITIEGSIEIDPVEEIVKVKALLKDGEEEKETETEWFLKIIKSECSESEAIGVYFYDSHDNQHAFLVQDVVEAVVESKHLLDMHINHDISPRAMAAWRECIIEKWDFLARGADTPIEGVVYNIKKAIEHIKINLRGN